MSTINPTVILSIVVPFYNEQEVIPFFFNRLIPILESINSKFEIICVNDGSKDNTLSMLLMQSSKDSRIITIDLSRNFGKEAAMTAGLDCATGLAVIPIDADLQDPPELIVQFYNYWLDGNDMVYGVRKDRSSDGWMKRQSSSSFYKIFNLLSDQSIPFNAGDFRLMDRRVIDTLKNYGERARFMKGLFANLGFKQLAVPFDRESRVAGMTKWNYWKLWNFALDGITAFTSFPLRVWTYIGLLLTSISIFMMLRILLGYLLHGAYVPGYASLSTMILFFSGAQFIGIGVLGEYLARIFTENKQRPLYVISSISGTQVLSDKLSNIFLPHGGFIAPEAGWQKFQEISKSE